MDDFVNISSPNYPQWYNDDQECTWILTSHITNAGYRIQIYDFQLDSLLSDEFIIGRSQRSLKMEILRTSHFVVAGTTIVLNDADMWIAFTSNNRLRQRGFQIGIQLIRATGVCSTTNNEDINCNDGRYCILGALICNSVSDCVTSSQQLQTCAACNSSDFWCLSGHGCVRQSMACDNQLQCWDGSDEIGCYLCESNITMSVNEVVHLTSPGYPIEHPRRVSCSWFVTSTDSTGSYTISFIDLSISYNYVAMGPTHEISDSNAVNMVDWWYPPNSVSIQHPLMWIQFVVIYDALTRKGFFMQVKRVNTKVQCGDNEFECEHGHSCLDPSLVCNNWPQCGYAYDASQDQSDEHGCDFCGASEMTVSADYPSSVRSIPAYPYNYPSYITCKWLIHTNLEDGAFNLKFINFHLVTNRDYLTIGIGHDVINSSTVLHLSGISAPNTLSIPGPTMWATFISTDGWWLGFTVEIQAGNEPVLCGLDEYLCESGYGCLNHSLLCDNNPQCLRGSDENGCGICGRQQYTLNQEDIIELNSPNYPLPYPANTHCSWRVVALNNGHPSITFDDFNLESSADFLYIQLEDVYMMNLTGLSVYDVPSYVASMGTSLTITFDTVGLTSSYRGFSLKLMWQEQNATCSPSHFTCEDTSLLLVCLYNHQICDREILCPDGSDEFTCDIDECTLGTDNCDTNAACNNTVGSFTCACNAGYHGDGVTCTDINECTLGTDNCEANAACTNTAGSFTCACNAGYSGDGVRCTDIDECTLKTDKCDTNAACTNTAGSFTCAYINECTLDSDNCDTNATCINTAGSFICACKSGYIGDGVTCTDIAECTLGIDNCGANGACTNTAGSFICACINECALGTDNCDANAACTDIAGSFICAYIDEYTLGTNTVTRMLIAQIL
ncbi:CUB and sushi domain-containing protein 1-like [Amphiura filiformis]|uniref:CUB and sushi domain-containing protein 1-like n=1 Tax=Amphiura filiformis TaxID=82378 RepID=UPI003B212813